MEISSNDRHVETIEIDQIKEKLSIFLLNWYKKNKRHFPWRETRDPYQVMVAEIMLQRTKAEQVLPIYTSFLKKFNNIQTLSRASSQELLDFFSKLGIIRRVKCLESLSKKLITNYDGKIPQSREELLSLPCLGEYSSDAILCFAYNRNVAVIDSNICRIVSRLFGLKTKGELRRDPNFRKMMNDLLPQKAKEFNWAMIDLGATICKPRKPLCNLCPIVSICSYHKLFRKIR